MSRHGRALLTLLATAFVACAAQAVESTPAVTRTVAFVGVDVLPMDRDRRLDDHTVVVRDGHIIEVAPSAQVRVPADAQRIDGTGKVLMPGLVEMHGHVPGAERPQEVEDTLLLYLANGVTLVRNMSGDPSHPALRSRIEAGAMAGPTLVVASPWLRGQDIATVEAEVRAHHAAGAQLIKLGSIPADTYPAMVRASNALGLPFAGHIPAGVGLVAALEAGQASIDHLDRYVEFLVPGAPIADADAGWFGSAWIDRVDPARIDEAVRRTVVAGTWNVPTLSLVEHMASSEAPERMIAWPEMRYMPATERARWLRAKREYAQRPDFQPEAAAHLVSVRRRLLKALHDGGAPIALGSDAPQFFNVPGFSLHREMAMMQAAGLTPYEVLATGTRNPARALGTPEAFGTIAVGRRADLVLLEDDPRQNLAHARDPVGVMARGQWWPRARLQAALEAIAARNAERD